MSCRVVTVSLNFFSGVRAVLRRNLLLVGQTSEMDREWYRMLSRADNTDIALQRYGPDVLR